MDDRDDDPEVRADLELRDSTARDRPRKSYEQVKWSPPVIVGQVPCRGRCGAVVDWPEDAEHSFQVFNGQLERTNQAPLDKTRIVFCEKCRAYGATLAADNNRKHVDKLAEVIRELRGGTTHPEAPGPAPHPDRERELLEQLRKLHHPDPVAFEIALREARQRSNSKNKRGGF